MTKRSDRPKFHPSPSQMTHAPEISGNDINGLGEEGFRRPQKVYWAEDPDTIAHGQMQKWFYTVNPGHDGFATERAKRQRILDEPLRPVAPRSQAFDPNLFDQSMNELMNAGAFDKFGATKLDQDWLFEDVQASFENIIILGFAHDYQEIKTAPDPTAGVEVMRQYTRAADAAMRVANLLRDAGHDADPLTGPMAGRLTMIPAALAAGFGELGKHGSLITPEFGSSFRLSAVLTNAPISQNEPREHGIDSFCENCQICTTACPPDAIFQSKQTVRGIEKYYVDFDKCIPFFNEHQGCAICIAVCPWSRPGVGLNLASKLQKRATRLRALDED